ncbi:hypothetical protein EVE76_15380 (plasmid) [Lactiplantibacillus plantarum]|uniref:hypothetical protein n=1 Tax=Lactiplantibacillus plantarum TaxID=1590 RepID=UPI00101773FC|nr:hypothetical protein [Lactiplantibacillus plantarum]QBA72756.1 hypothetical protein EVE76_15380 [Lactiplantibacillus plantarum]
MLIIVKKNTRVLQAWVDRFRNSKKLKGNALFIVDDEADAASENTKVNQKKVSAINDRLRKIRDTAQASIYLQVTGTPQALLLQSLNSNWRPMFTEYFEPGNGYLGGDFSFQEQRLTIYLTSFILLVMKHRKKAQTCCAPPLGRISANLANWW